MRHTLAWTPERGPILVVARTVAPGRRLSVFRSAYSNALPWADGLTDAPEPAPDGGWRYLNPGEVGFLTAAVDRMIPPDPTGPGASEAGVAPSSSPPMGLANSVAPLPQLSRGGDILSRLLRFRELWSAGVEALGAVSGLIRVAVGGASPLHFRLRLLPATSQHRTQEKRGATMRTR